ncbi:DUF1983 domain-containing protein, partial [Glaesserella parasuis]|nr:DUF1983 domain-containing protein [Glaesserella parasuis]
NEDGSYGITALQHEPQKERIVDEGAVFAPLSETRHKVEPQLTHLGVQPTLSGDMKVSWEVTSGNSTVKYDIKVLKDGKLYLFKRDESSSELNLADLANGEYQVTIIARDAQGRMLSEKVQSFTIDNPPTPKNVSVSGGLSGITLSWDFVDEATQTEIWASSTNNLANAERIAKVTANIYTHNVGPRQTRYYWLRHTRGINVGDWYQQQGLSAETGADIDAELALLNEKLSQNIIEEVFDTAMPARKLEMIKTVARIDNPTENIGHKQLYNEADGKLYVWDGRKYTAKVQAVDLEGQLASSQLDQALVNQLTTASSTANNALSKANTVQSALAQETRARTQALQAEATARGTAVSRLEQADRNQAQSITTATAKADNALSGLSEERQARIAGDKAQSEQLVALTSRLGTTEATISSTSRTITTLDGKVQSMHTIQAVSIAGNRKALAGISLGSNGGTESSVIVMADKFNVVKNARDGNVKPMFSVVNNKVAINGDLMADGIVSARMMGANSIAAGAIQGGAIRANHIAVGEISAEKLASEAVTTEKIRSNTITSDKIGAGQITTNHMVAGSIDGKILRAGTVTADKVVARVSLQSPVIRGGILEVGSLIGGNLYEVKSFTPAGRNQMSITIKPSIAQRLLKMTWDYGTVRFSGNSAAIGGTGDWVTSIKNSAGTVSQHLKGFYTLVIPSNTQVTLSLTFNTTRIMNQILVETVVYSGSSYIQ